MESAPTRFYPCDGTKTPTGCSTGGPAAAGGGEFPDSTITRAQRDACKKLIQPIAETLTPHELMFMACALEDAAQRKRAGEDRR